MLYLCSLTRPVNLDLMYDLSIEQFIVSFKGMTARGGGPEKTYSHNFSTFQAAFKWLHDYLPQYSIKWQFNLIHAPWWGGQFERLGKILTWQQLVSLLLDVEISLNKRWLGYVEDDIECPILKPNVQMLTT